MSESTKKVIDVLDSVIDEDNIAGSQLDGTQLEITLKGVPVVTFPIEVEKFCEIKKSGESEIRRLAFIDGGNRAIINAANFVVQFNRVCFTIYKEENKGEKKEERMCSANSLPDMEEFFSITYTKFENSTLYYKNELVPTTKHVVLPDKNDLSFSAADRRIGASAFRADIERVSTVPRRFSELLYASTLVEAELSENDVVIIDGSLQVAYPNENKYSQKLFKAASDRGVIAMGIPKRCRLYTNTGLSIVAAVSKLAEKCPYKMWYLPIAEVNSYPFYAAKIYMVKLNPNANHIYRLEIYLPHAKKLEEENKLNDLFIRLAKNSQDPTLPGYPYGLVHADLKARVRKEERDILHALLLDEGKRLGKIEKLLRNISATDTHDMLNQLG
ncbi:MAG: DNA double-strand break repair nuclease NurA [Candidatus Korarchaeota archaeon]